MSTNESPAVELDASPTLVRSSLFKLFVDPAGFFSDLPRLRENRLYLLLAWISGVAYAIDRLDTNMLKGELGASNSALLVADSWLKLWPFILFVGLLNGAVLWFMGGWWYRKRLAWSGAVAPNELDARMLYVYQDFVQSAPTIALLVLQTAFFANYIEAWNSEELWSSVILIFPVWSCIVSYKGARIAFGVSKGKGRFWFIIAPLGFYAALLIVLSALYVTQAS